MPMSGSNYVAPTWVDGGPPALDAEELQAMCDTIQENQGDVTSLQSAVSSISSLVNGKSTMQVVTYIGTGTAGESNPTSISFSGQPKLLIVVSQNQNNVMLVATRNTDTFVTVLGAGIFNGTDGLNISFSGNTVSYYWGSGGSPALYQLNENGYQYTAVAFF